MSDDLHLSRFALTALLEQQEEISVVASVDSDHDMLSFADAHKLDVVIISFEGQDKRAIEVAKKVSPLPNCRCMLLTTAFTRSSLREAFDAGIRGIVERSASPRQFVDAIHRVHQGDRVFDADLTVTALVGGGDCPLSPREFSVLECASCGDTVTEIAAQLHLSEGTVRNYLSSVVSKLGARSRIDAVRIAREAHWI